MIVLPTFKLATIKVDYKFLLVVEMKEDISMITTFFFARLLARLLFKYALCN